MLDYKQGIAFIAQIMHHPHQPPDVARMQSNAGFVHHEECVHERRAKAGCEIDPLHFTAAERASRTIEREIADADLTKITQSRADFIAQHCSSAVIRRDFDVRQDIERGRNRKCRELGESELLRRAVSAVRLISGVTDRRYNFVVQGLRLVTSTLTARTFHISAVSTEQDAHVHLVSLRFEPAKETADPVPAIIFVILIRVFVRAFLPVDDKILVSLREFLEWCVDIDLLAGTSAQQILLRFAHFLPAKNAHHPLRDRARAVRDRAIQIDRNGAAEAAAFRAGTKRIVETEKSRARRSNVEIAMRAVPAGRKRKFTTCSGGRVGRSLQNSRRHTCLHTKRDDVDLALTESKRRLDGLSQSCAIFFRDDDAVLNDLNARAEAFDFSVTINTNNV